MLSGEMAEVDTSFSRATPTAGPRVWVIAEIGVNHDGEVGRALELVAAAAAAGADAVKLQHFRPGRLLAAGAGLASYQKRSERDAASMLGRLTLTLEELASVRDAARRRGLAVVATPFSLEDVSELGEVGLDAVKIASPDVVNVPLLEAAAGLGVPMLVSTGAASLDEVAAAAVLLHRHGAASALLQCVSSYPTPDEEAALSGIGVLASEFRLPVGYSDHTTSTHTGAMAVAAGACVLEKHLTYDRGASGPDHAASLDPQGFTEYVVETRWAASVMGPWAKRVHESEAEVRRLCRQSLYAARTLRRGEALRREDVTIRRPASGLPAGDLEWVLGCTLVRDVAAGEAITAEAVGMSAMGKASGG